jgi:hypothetical protein
LFGASTSAGRPSAGDNVGHGVGLARAGDAEQGLERQAVVEALGQQADGLGLVAGRRKRLVQAPRTARKLDHPALQFMTISAKTYPLVYLWKPDEILMKAAVSIRYYCALCAAT